MTYSGENVLERYKTVASVTPTELLSWDTEIVNIDLCVNTCSKKYLQQHFQFWVKKGGTNQGCRDMILWYYSLLLLFLFFVFLEANNDSKALYSIWMK